jgi:hypothetical protein
VNLTNLELSVAPVSNVPTHRVVLCSSSGRGSARVYDVRSGVACG